MKLAHARPKAGRDQLREEWRRSRATAQALSIVYPQVESIRLDLQFAEQTAHPPVPQVHVLHPPAGAFFEYCCPHSDCDGHFDLTAAVRSVLKDEERQIAGCVHCNGERAKDRTGKQPCGLLINYAVSVQYVPASRR